MDRRRLSTAAADLVESGVDDLVVDGCGTVILTPAPPRSFSRRTEAAVDILVVTNFAFFGCFFFSFLRFCECFN